MMDFQNALWYIEGEITTLPAILDTDYYALAVASGQNTNIPGIYVLNLYTDAGLTQDSQSLITVRVPEPGILILLGIAMSAIGAASWRLRKL